MPFRPQNTGRNAYRYIALSIKTVVIFADTGIKHPLSGRPYSDGLQGAVGRKKPAKPLAAESGASRARAPAAPAVGSAAQTAGGAPRRPPCPRSTRRRPPAESSRCSAAASSSWLAGARRARCSSPPSRWTTNPTKRMRTTSPNRSIVTGSGRTGRHRSELISRAMPMRACWQEMTV